jgi:phosphoheptose isomerase
VPAKLDAGTAKWLNSEGMILCPENPVGENRMGSIPYFPSAIFEDAGSYADAYFGLCAAAAATVDREALAKAGRLLAERAAAGALIFSCGNGGSAAIANHLVCDCMKGVRTGSWLKPKVVSLSATVELITAIVNDIGPAEMFAHQLSSLASPGDVLIAISSSGASPNIIRALEMARAMKLTTIAMTGFSGGEAARLADITLHVDAQNYGVVEDVHQSLMHIMAQYLRHSHLEDSSSLGSVKF